MSENNRDTLFDRMAVRTMAEEENEGNSKGGGPTKIIIIAVVASIVLSGAIAGGVAVFLGGSDDGQQVTEGDEEAEAAEVESTDPPIYHSMDPKFVVSFRDQKKARFMQFSLEIMARDRDVIQDIKQHSPAVRSNLLLLIDNQDSVKMSTREGKEQLLVEMTADINQTLEQVGATSGVEAAYYNSFVIQ